MFYSQEISRENEPDRTALGNYRKKDNLIQALTFVAEGTKHLSKLQNKVIQILEKLIQIL